MGEEGLRLVYSVHAVQRMAERGIREVDVARVVREGREIESYPDNKPYPSRLVLGWADGKPIHVVAASAEDAIIVITVYEPDRGQWDTGFERRKR